MSTLQTIDHNGRRWYIDGDGKHYVSVTQAISYISDFLGEDEWAGVPKSILEVHRLEGIGCHEACLNWLAFTHGLYSRFDLPVKPPNHPDEGRWKNVIANALRGFEEWCDKRKPTPLCIEQPSVNTRYGLAGCPDFKGVLSISERHLIGVKAIIELKFTAALIKAHRIQTRTYRRLDGYQDCRLGVLVRIDRGTGAVDEQMVLWDQEPHHDAAVLHALGLLQWSRQHGS